MTPDQITIVKDCAARLVQGNISFHEVVDNLTEIGVERYHADYSRREGTYYMPNGQSLVVWMKYPSTVVAEAFSLPAMKSAIGQVQRKEIKYPDFVTKIMAAGCVGCFIQITTRRILYFGRNGEVHVEPFSWVKKS